VSRRRRLLVLAAILGVVALAASYTALRTPPTGPPSMVLILVDTLRADRVGPAASGESLTPNLDDLARGGLRFERAYAPSSWTLPSVTSMLTGQMPSEHGVRSWVHAGVPASSPYLPELLADQGYVTTAVMGNANLGQAGFGRGFDLFVEARTEPKLARSGIPLYPSAEDMTDLAIEVLDQVQESRFFLYVHYMDPHAPYLLPRGADDPFAGSDYQGYVVTHLEQVLPLVGRRYTRVYPYFWSKVRTGVEADRSRVRQLYDEKVRYTDRHLGRLLDHLDTLGLADSTLVVVTSDHGEGLFEHGIREHEEVPYEHQVRVPLIARGPDLDIGAVVQMAVEQVDLTAALTSIAAGNDVEGADDLAGGNGALVEVLTGQVQSRKSGEVVSEVYVADRDEHLQMALSEGQKLIRSKDRSLMFDLGHDPAELDDLSDDRDSGHLGTLIDARIGPLPTGAARAEITDPELLERLRALGYVD